MKHLVREDTIDKLLLSTRAYNALRRAEICTVGGLVDTPIDVLAKIQNMGAKSLSEITETLQGITLMDSATTSVGLGTSDMSETIPCFIGRDGGCYQDIVIEDLGLSRRSYNCLIGAEINVASQLLDMSESDLFAIQNMGKKSVS